MNVFEKYTTSGTKSLANDGPIDVVDNQATVELDGSSTATFVSY